MLRKTMLTAGLAFAVIATTTSGWAAGGTPGSAPAGRGEYYGAGAGYYAPSYYYGGDGYYGNWPGYYGGGWGYAPGYRHYRHHRHWW